LTRISVVTATFKPGYIVTMSNALKNQRFKDFEWILIDDLYDLRGDLVKEHLDKIGLNYIYKPPRKLVDYFAAASSWNTVFLYAKGELLYFLNDYEFPLSKCLERHWSIYKKYGPKVIISGITMSHTVPMIDLTFLDLYNPHPKYQLNIFKDLEEPRTINPEIGILPLEHEVEPLVYQTNIHELARVGRRGWWAGRNDSAPLELCLDLNGFNEGFDGVWGGQDVDFHERAEEAYGAKYMVDGSLDVLSLELPNPFAGQKRQTKDLRARDQEMYKIRDEYTRGKHYFKSFNDWNIREERKRLGTN